MDGYACHLTCDFFVSSLTRTLPSCLGSCKHNVVHPSPQGQATMPQLPTHSSHNDSTLRITTGTKYSYSQGKTSYPTL